LTSNNRNKQMPQGTYAAKGYGVAAGSNMMNDPYASVSGNIIMQRD